MKRNIFYFLALIGTLSCVDNSTGEDKLIDQSATNSKDSAIDWSKVEFIKEPCEKSETMIDSILTIDTSNCHIKVDLVCLEDYIIKDSSVYNLEDKSGDFSPLYSNYKYIISITRGKTIIESEIKKEILTDSLSANFVKDSNLGTVDFKEYKDSSFVFAGCIGVPGTDYVYMFDFSINNKTKIKILKTYDVEYGN